MRRYETLYIINPNLVDEDYKSVLKKFSDLIEKKNGVIVKIEEWGKQKLAYLVRKFDQGSYVLIDYCGEPAITADVERELKLDDRVLKYQTVKLADNVDPQALIVEENATGKGTAEAADQVPEKEEAVESEGTESAEEVKNGI